VLICLVVAPLLATFAASVWIVVGWDRPGSPFWPEPHMTMSEAVAINNLGEIVRLIKTEGQDPNRRWSIRRGMLGEAQTLTPLETAVAVRRIQAVHVLLREGAVVPSESRARNEMLCRAAESGDPEIVGLLLAASAPENTTVAGLAPRPACPPASTR
jgi:hypothetical protein